MTNIKLDDTWRGTNESFLMHYNDQLRLLDSLVEADEKLPDNTRVTFLESAVESVPDLRRVKITDNVLQAQLDSTRPISYRSYFDLLKDAAFHLDQATKRGNKIRRTNVHFSGPNDEDEHQTLSSDDPQVIQQEDVCSEPPEHLSYSVFQSHFQGSSTSNTQKIFLPKPIWEKLSKDQQQMIIDHNRSLPKSGSSHLPTPNKSPSPLPHKPTPQQTAKSQQAHTHQSDESTADTTKTETTPSDPLLAMVHQSINTSDDDASDITKVLSAKRSRQIQVCKRYLFQHANHTNNQLVDRGANVGLAGSDMRVIHKPHRKINISGIDNHEVTGLDVVTAGTPSEHQLLQQTPSSLTPLLLMMVQPWPNFSVAMIPLSVMHMASNQPNNSSTPSLITSEKGEPWIPSSVMEANMISPSESLISSVPCSSKIISLNLIINIKIRQKIALDLPSVTPTLS